MKKVKAKDNIINDFQYSEAIKTLRTNLIFSGEDIRAVAITSFEKGEGKSTISFQLACSLAENNLKVLFLEADLSAGVLQNTLHVRDKIDGVSNYLAGNVELDDLICKTDLPNLNIMFSGPRVVNSAELLGSEKFDDLVKELKERYDYVIIDAAPLGQIVDCAVIAHAVDGVLLVIDVKDNNYKYELKIKEQIVMSGGKVIGAILNGADYKKKSYYRKKYYNRYGYGYGYGYGRGKQKKDETPTDSKEATEETVDKN